VAAPHDTGSGSRTPRRSRSDGERSRAAILREAARLATVEGLDGLSLARLADAVGMSKSGLFAHFGSKEDLQIEVLRAAARRFEEFVWRPAIKVARGEPRLRKVLERWLLWVNEPSMPGGCIFVAAAAELDDKDGRPREFLVGEQRKLCTAIAKAARLAVEEGHFRRDLDCDQLAFDAYSLVLGYNFQRRLLRDPKAEARARRAIDRLLVSARAPG
jgi:AcrR family transcriptional regulator